MKRHARQSRRPSNSFVAGAVQPSMQHDVTSASGCLEGVVPCLGLSRRRIGCDRTPSSLSRELSCKESFFHVRGVSGVPVLARVNEEACCILGVPTLESRSLESMEPDRSLRGERGVTPPVPIDAFLGAPHPGSLSGIVGAMAPHISLHRCGSSAPAIERDLPCDILGPLTLWWKEVSRYASGVRSRLDSDTRISWSSRLRRSRATSCATTCASTAVAPRDSLGLTDRLGGFGSEGL